MKERIKKLRKKLGLTQQQFADKLGISRGNIATYETRDGSPGNSVINLICREFNVSENWLRTGEGEMFIQQSRTDEISTFMNRLMQSEPDDIRRRFVSAISRLSTDELKVLERTALHLAEELKDLSGSEQEEGPMGTAAKPAELKPQTVEVATDMPTEDDVEDIVQKGCEMLREQALLEKKRASKASSANESAAG